MIKKKQKRKKKDTRSVGTASQRISLCMIVKNEEKFLPQCLDSVKDWVDEIIIVDTGSTDRTVEIAKRYTNKIYFHPWEDSFSKARNQALAYATGDWILIMDADEELVREDIPVLLEAVKNEELDAIMVQIVSKLREGKSEAIHSVERIFRNNGKIHYEGRVHNRLAGIKHAKVYPIRLIHYGYNQTQIHSKKKFDRTVSLLKMDLEDDPNNPKTYHYLGCSYLSEEMYQQAFDASLMAIRLAEAENDQNMIYLWSHYNAAMSYYRLKELNKAKETSMSALSKYPKHIDSHYVLSLVYFDQKQWPRVIEHGNEYVRLIKLLKTSPEAFDNLVTCSVNEEWNVKVLMGIAHFELDQIKRSHEAFETAVSCAPEPLIALRATGIYFHNKKYLSKALEYLKRAHRENPEDQTVNTLIEHIESAGVPEVSEPTISCCMIVKNEEAFLKQCLESVKDYVDEIIIVDTGSTDKTVEIAKHYTDKVHFHPWEDSFSKARNQSLAYATCDWIFIIDGDEELLNDNGKKLREVVREAGSADAIHVNTISTYSNGNKEARHNSERLFKNNGIIHYDGIVHNRVEGATNTKASNIEVMHYGYNVDEEKAAEKFLRTSELLKKQIKENPDDPMPHHYLGTAYLSRSMIEMAREELVLAIDLAKQKNDDNPLYLWSHHNVGLALFSMGDLEQAKIYSLQAIEKCPKHTDSFYLLTLIAAEEGKWKDVLSFGNNYIKLVNLFEEHPDQAGLIVNATMKDGASIHLVMGHSFHAFKDYDQMSKHYQKAYEISDKKWEVWFNAGCFHMDRSQDFERASNYLNLALEESPEEQEIWYMLAKLNKKTKLFQDEKQCLEKLFILGTEDIVILNRLASLCIEAGDFDGAFEALDKAKKSGTLNYPAMCNLGLIYRKQEQMEKAIQTYMQALELHHQGVGPWINLGEISLELDRLDEARVFFERVLTLQSGLVKVLLQLCEIELRQNRMLEFVRRCDLVLKELDLNRDRTINDIEDVVAILLEIDFAVRNTPKIATQALRVLCLLPLDFASFFHTSIGVLLENKHAEETEFILRELGKLGQTQKHPQVMLEEIVSDL